MDQKCSDFIKNTVVYDKAIKERLTNYDMKGYNSGYFDFTFNQYDFPKRCGRWYIELKYGSSVKDYFYNSIIKLFENSSISLDVIANDLKILISKNKINVNDKKYGHLLHYAWYFTEGLPFCEKMEINGKSNYNFNDTDLTYKNIGKLFIPYVANFEEEKHLMTEFKDAIRNEFDVRMKKVEEDIKNQKNEVLEKRNITIESVKTMIENSTLHQDIKEEIFNNITNEYQDLLDMAEEGVIVHDDTLFGSIGDEDNWLSHFKSNLKNFPFNIITEHWTILYEPTFREEKLKRILK